MHVTPSSYTHAISHELLAVSTINIPMNQTRKLDHSFSRACLPVSHHRTHLHFSTPCGAHLHHVLAPDTRKRLGLAVAGLTLWVVAAVLVVSFIGIAGLCFFAPPALKEALGGFFYRAVGAMARFDLLERFQMCTDLVLVSSSEHG